MPIDPSSKDIKSLAKRFWPDCDTKILKEISGGYSGAVVLLVDIKLSAVSRNTTPLIEPGQYILKVQDQNPWPDEAEESTRHSDAVAKNREFSSAHIPELRYAGTIDGLTFLLYDVAGQSLASFVAADTVDAAAVRYYCALAARDLWLQFNQHYSINTTTSARGSLRRWLGYRLDPTKAPQLHEFVATECGGQSVFRIANRVLVNPLYIASSDCIDVPVASVSFDGMIHGDLHLGNILVDRRLKRRDEYWLIDFALAMAAPLGFDQAYLELSILIGLLQGVEPQRILNILEALESIDDPHHAVRVPVSDVGIVDFCKGIRQANGNWQTSREPKRSDSVEAQCLLARIAAGLNWMNKPLTQPKRRLALAYAAWAATLYLDRFHPDEFAKLLSEQGQARQVLPPTVTPAWPDVWEQLGRFDDTKAKYVLVTERLDVSKESQSLALVPWSAVVDLDPFSNESGLHSAIGATLAAQRSVNQYGLSSIPMDVDRGTAWFMGNGWPSRYEPVPRDFRHWRSAYGQSFRQLLREIQRMAAPLPVKIVILASPQLDQRLLKSLIDMADESLEASSDITLIGLALPEGDPALKARHAMAVPEFLGALYQVFGASIQVDEPAIPGGEGPTPLSLDQLRSLEEDLDLLHSKVLTQASMADGVTDAFWKGNPPRWSDLHADVDVRRIIGSQLLGKVRGRLYARGNYTVELRHPPGSGGTTVALRCGWDLRREFPVAVLRQYSETTADRIDELFRISQKPVLLIAEAALLPPANREILYHEIAKRNVRCVILYVVRTFANQSEKSETYQPTERLEIKEPMEDGEAKDFLIAFAERTKNVRRLKLLNDLATLDQWKPYRNPFFFGLITYEEEFKSVNSYVQHHLAPTLTEPVKQVVRFLALVTKYSQAGINIGLLNKFLGREPDADFDINKSLGEVIARLIVRRGSIVRLLHPVIAQEVLRQSLGGESWRYGLKDLCLKFISQTAKVLGPDAEETMHLFSELFIRRDYWTQSDRSRPHFSELISDIPNPPGQHAVLLELTKTCPREAHFWNHLGRHHIYVMKQDFAEAEKILKKAVVLSDKEQVHHHSLGMVRRFWIRSLLDDMMKRESKPTPEEMIAVIQPLFAGAAEEFSHARRLSPEDNHGYITHIQLILEILEKVLSLDSESTLPAILGKTNAVGEWSRESIIVAEDLLRQVQHLREQEKASRFETFCKNKLGVLYGHFDAVISSLEALSKSAPDPDVRRALATAYFSKSGRVWANLSASELRSTKELMEDNLETDPTNDRDIRSWFQAFRRLPEFSYIEAIDRLEGWAHETKSLDAYYYLYILHFLRWKQGAERDESNMRANLEQCRQRAIGKRGLSYEWLATEPSWCPLANTRELGEWKGIVVNGERREFWENPEPLAVVTGSIASIRPQAGTIRLGPHTVAYFVPGVKFSETRHLNALVTCYLGFSYDGLRAWSVELLADDNAATIGELIETKRDVEGSAEPKSGIGQGSGPSPSDSDPALQDNTSSLATEVERFINELLEVSSKQRKTLYLSALGNRLVARFGRPQVHEQLGYNNLEEYLLTIPWLNIRGTGGLVHIVKAK